MSNLCELNSMRRFQVRDVSSSYGNRPCFDVVFHDEENRCERYSESVWDTHEAALQVAEYMERHETRPYHWDIVRKMA